MQMCKYGRSKNPNQSNFINIVQWKKTNGMVTIKLTFAIYNKINRMYDLSFKLILDIATNVLEKI